MNEDDEYIKELIAAKTDPAYIELKKDFAFLEGQDFIGLEDFVFDEDQIDNEAADKAEKYIEKHGTISWDEMEKRLGINNK